MAWTGTGDIVPKVIVAFVAPVSVSTKAVVNALTELGNTYRDLTFTLRNHDVTNNAALYVETSESGSAIDGQPTQVIVGPGNEVQLEFRNVLKLWWRVSASGDPDGGLVAVNISFQITGMLRYAQNTDLMRLAR